MPRAWSHYFPFPLVGVVVLQLLLIFLTPNLLSSGTGPSAGSLETQAELVVDRVVGGSVTHFYVEGLGTVRYHSVTVDLAANVTWPPASVAALSWSNPTVTNDTLAVPGSSGVDPFAVNVTAIYVDSSGGTVWYYGAFAFHVVGTTLYVDDLLATASPISSTPVASLPLPLLLSASSTGGVP